MKYLLSLIIFLSLPSFASFRVIDGDTILVPMDKVRDFPNLISIRLLGVNTAETRTAKCPEERAAGEAAKQFVQTTLSNAKTIEYKFVQWDKFGGRVDGLIIVDDKNLSELLVENNYAVRYDGVGPRVNVWCNK